VHRGGIGSEHAWVLRPGAEDVELVLFGHGMEQPSSSGVRGGEPGLQNAFYFDRRGTDEVPPPKLITQVRQGDEFVSWCAGGGGIGDGIDRDPSAVLADVDEGLVTVEGAARDYKVVLAADGDGWRVDETATNAARDAEREARIGRTPRQRGKEHASGRRLSTHLQVVGERITCRSCGENLCHRSENVKKHLVMQGVPVSDRWPLSAAYEGASRFVYRRFYCPGCATRMYVEVNLVDTEPVWSVEVLEST
jgi:N-methylhydantoinase B